MSKKRKTTIIISVLITVAILLVVTSVIAATLAATTRFVVVSGNSMNNTFYDGDKLIVSNFNYEPKPGDVVVLDIEGVNTHYIKRVIATEGQTVRIDFEKWEVYVDGVLLEEDYVLRRDGDMHYAAFYDGEFTVPEGHVYVMGDNRNDSTDSRVLGCLAEQSIIGKVIYAIQEE